MPGRLTQRVAQSALAVRGFRSRYVPTPAGRVHLWEATGQGTLPPLVVLPGISSAGFHYYPLLRHLRRHVRHLVTVDLPGHGLSDVPPQGLSPDTLREGLYAAFETLHQRFERPAFFGNSLGGLVALRYALAHPERVRALALFAPAGAAMSFEEVDRLRRSLHLDSHREALEFVDRVFVRPARLKHVLAWGVRRTFAPRHIRKLIGHLEPELLLSHAELQGLQVPTLVLWGQHDQVLPQSSLEFFRRSLPPHAQVEVRHDAGHTPFEAPSGIARRVVAFLSECP